MLHFYCHCHHCHCHHQPQQCCLQNHKTNLYQIDYRLAGQFGRWGCQYCVVAVSCLFYLLYCVNHNDIPIAVCLLDTLINNLKDICSPFYNSFIIVFVVAVIVLLQTIVLHDFLKTATETPLGGIDHVVNYSKGSDYE